MTRILALDTSVQTCSVALHDNGFVLARSQQLAKGHSRLVLPMIDELLAEAGLLLGQLDALALTIGPGSFTGLRIGISVVQGLAFGADIPVVSVSTLQTMAAGAIKRHSVRQQGTILPAFDARMGEIYWGLYRNVGGKPVACCADALNVPEAVGLTDDAVHGGVVTLGVGDGWQYACAFPVTAQTTQIECQPSAQDLVILALEKYAEGEAKPVEQLTPVYLRDTVSWKKRTHLRTQG